MGTLGNSIFQTMLGWIRSLGAEIWQTASGQEGETFFQWIGAHWKGLAAGLCLAGLILDLIVYLFRWQPYRAWRGFLRRRGRMPAVEETEETDDLEAEDAEESPDFHFAQQYEQMPPEDGAAFGLLKRPEGEKFPEEYDPIPEEKTEEIPEDDRPFRAEESNTPLFEQAILPNRRRRVTRFFQEGNEEAPAPDQLIDRYAAYRRPVYPRSWQKDEGDEEE